MKPFEQFLKQMKEAAHLVQAKDPAAATAVIQEALQASGLLPAQVTPTKQAAAQATPQMVDLNPVPGWAQKLRHKTMPGHQPAVATPDPRAPGEFLERTFAAGGDTRRYKLYVPSAPATGQRPLLVMLHGCTQNADDFAAGTAMNALAEEHGCLVLYPEQSATANASRCWNWFEASHQERDGGEPSLLAAMTREVVDTWQADPKRVFVAGLSAGGAMAAILGQAYPELYAAVGVHSGLPVGSARDLITGLAAMKKAPGRMRKPAGKLLRRVPVIVFHGDQDNIVHPGHGDAVLRQFHPASHGAVVHQQDERTGQAGGRGHTRTAVLDRSGRTVAEYWTLHGAGHSWSGGSAAGTYTDPAGPDASAEMLRFFLAHGHWAPD
jgi:poly(hydroxyalkanoate) depolymerase family esterase